MGPFVGPSHVIKSMQEFEALRFMRAGDLLPEQKVALNTIREAMGMPAVGTRVSKILKLDDAFAKVTSGNPNLSGFYARTNDVYDAQSTGALIDRLRLDRQGGLSAGDAHVVLETEVSDAIRANARIPRSPEYSRGTPDEFVEDLPFPNSGNGIPASRDGRILPEYTTAATTMPAGDAINPKTVMKFKLADGSPFPITINGQTASEWKLTQLAPDAYRWEPL